MISNPIILNNFKRSVQIPVDYLLNEAIEIVSMTDAGVSNRNRVETSKKFKDIEAVLTDPDSWTDDLSFKDKLGNIYFIDDLIDKTVKIGGKTITVIEETVYEGLLTEASAVENRIKELAEDPEIQSKMGADAKKLEHAFMVLFKRGYGAAQTNWAAVHPTIKKLGKGDAAYNAWGHARLNAFIDKRQAYKTSDSDVADWLNGKGEKPEPK